MRVSFVETMRGTLSGDDGVAHPAEFTLHVEAPSTRAFLFEGRCTVRGVLRAAPWAPEVPCEGELVITRLPTTLGYFLRARGADGRALRLEGAKRVSPLRLLRTMTTLPLELSDAGGAVLARGVFAFDLKDLLPFLATFSPLSRRPRALVDAARAAARRRALAESPS